MNRDTQRIDSRFNFAFKLEDQCNAVVMIKLITEKLKASTKSIPRRVEG